MKIPIHGYAASSSGEALEKIEYQPQELGPLDIEVKITHCGICHSDVHLVKDGWGISRYPLVPGHEIVGIVSEVGAFVENIKVNDRVGIGWQSCACLTCDFCLQGAENLCQTQKATCVAGYGGFAEAIQVNSRFAFSIPDRLSSANAAPLLCGGITVYSPLRHFNVLPAMKIGILGIGGLGHLALQYAHAFGCEVTAFSSSPAKEQEAKLFGADHFMSSTDPRELEKMSNSLDFILSTVYADLDWPSYLGLLKPNGKLCMVGVPQNDIQVPVSALIGGQRTVCGSSIGSRSMIGEMLAFSARQGIEAQIQVMSMDKANEGLSKVAANQARYRIVLSNELNGVPQP